MCATALLVLGTLALPGVHSEAGHNIACTNDYDKMMHCQFSAQNCAEYYMTVRSNGGYGEDPCKPVHCGVSLTGQCCCSAEMTLVRGETHTAVVRKGSQDVDSRVIAVTDTIKPKAATNLSVRESNGNFLLTWKTDIGRLPEDPQANVTYHKKGSTDMVSEFINPETMDGKSYHEILGEHLEPSTTYVVSVKSYVNESGLFSDSSNEVEFHTPVAPHVLITAVIVSLSVAAVIISAVIYGCYVKVKTMWWDKCPNPKLPIMQQSKQQLLKPRSPSMSRICIEPLAPLDTKSWSKGSLKDISGESSPQSSGISTVSSCFSYATTEPPNIIACVQDALGKAFPNISPISPFTTNPLTESGRPEDTSSGSASFFNRTYSILIPNFPQQISMDSSGIQTQEEMLCDSPYHPCEGDVVICPDQQAPASPLIDLSPAVVPHVPVDMSYQQCNADSGKFSYTEDSGLSPFSSGANTTVSQDPVSRLDEVVGSIANLNVKASAFDDNPCYGCAPAAQTTYPTVDDDYQAFQNLVRQPDILSSESKSDEEEHHWNKYLEDSPTQVPQSFLSSPLVPDFNNQGGHCLPAVPFLSLASADQSSSVITESGYHSV